ncbi:MAG: TlpA family protein disulfide reductase [Myxococcales bacterium]|nr:TlpA family protein disulfide reductase [Myxococcales bacterium]
MTDAAPSTPSSWTFLRGLARDWGIAAIVVVVVFMGYNLLFPPRPPGLGPAPDFTLNNLEGQQVTLSSVDSDLVVLNFWFTTCPPCRAEIPELTAFARDNPDIELYGVSTDVNMPPGRLQRESHKLGIRYPVLHDVRADVARRYGVSVFPTTLVIRDMQIVQARVGIVNREQLDEMVAASR